jgi:hypothetical protein
MSRRRASIAAATVVIVVAVWLAFDLIAKAFFVIDGDDDCVHTYVVEIVIGGSAQQTICSGTVIDRNRILTAAHCISGHETEPFGYKLAVESQGNGDPHRRICKHESDSRPIISAAYPGLSSKQYKGHTPPGPKVAPRNCSLCYAMIGTYAIHDVGVLVTKEYIPIPSGELPNPSIPWADIIRNQNSLVFSGFGITRLNDKGSSGNRTKGTRSVDSADDWRFFFQQEAGAKPTQNICNGDSGGPTFYKDKNGEVIVGIASTGNSDCTVGSLTRVDAYLDWINKGYKRDLVNLPPPTEKKS